MSKKIKYPNGFVGVCSDEVAQVLGKRKDHKILGDADKPEKAKAPEEEKKDKE